MKKKYCAVIVICLLIFTSLFAEYLWQEDFEGMAVDATQRDGYWTTSGTPTATGYWAVKEVSSNKHFSGNRLDNVCVWITDPISISSRTGLSIECKIAEIGTMTGSDYIKGYYKIDSGAEIEFFSQIDDMGASWVTKSVSVNEGSNVVITIKAYTTDANKTWRFDDVFVSSDTPLPVTLSSFTVTQVMNSFVNVQWSTASESGLNCFNIYRDGEFLGSVNATNTTETVSYSFADENFGAEQTYHYWLEIVELDGSTSMVGPQTITTTGQQEPGTPAVPKMYGLYQNYPNPFNPDTQISFSVPGTTRGQLVIYTTTGQVVKQLFDGIIQPQKIYTISWDGTDSTDKPVASGLYLYRLQTEKASYSKRMIMLK